MHTQVSTASYRELHSGTFICPFPQSKQPVWRSGLAGLHITGQGALFFYPFVEPGGLFLAKASYGKVVVVVVKTWRDGEAATSQGACSGSYTSALLTIPLLIFVLNLPGFSFQPVVLFFLFPLD